MSSLWYQYAMQLFCKEKKLLLYCENCEKLFFIREENWKRFGGYGNFYNLRDLQIGADCCSSPEWLFVTNCFSPSREIGDECPVSFLEGLKEERRLELIWRIYLGKPSERFPY